MMGETGFPTCGEWVIIFSLTQISYGNFKTLKDTIFKQSHK